ncbi:MAG: C4-type zinc ribbon domain-containing protein [Bacteroidota bacterium]|nr:C4-type zinc ribbon domain-containing protein [Candidatus Kapabacteria bacterium]MCS7302097.1 C4-type zinc ribbon domain-containing protein [Candidatus Kapabacteria bacterium]MCX7936511.1 C4-type zinc ribbon domain-containing protein [Chlorobiota bacterium]MDW8074672.1 C4-type zinc ribbon domain-containing protein [Bacteroidota bacterium]MDW8270852.1 C4-type zinc ribbon domain-containing protein [Bacteroidota bacterium]
MPSNVELIARLAYIDEKLDDMHAELGDLPKLVKKLEDKLRHRMRLVEETQKALNDIAHFRSMMRMRLQELADKEAELNQKQFGGQIRNNREFDAITHEIEFIRAERLRIEQELAQNAIKEENLTGLLERQKADVEETTKELREREEELNALATEQDTEFRKLQSERKAIIEQLSAEWYAEYERIRSYHADAAVHVRKGSCSGCFSAIPAQVLVEMRNYPERMFVCEHCGRILYPEHYRIEEEELT